jgi:hypothetical protein
MLRVSATSGVSRFEWNQVLGFYLVLVAYSFSMVGIVSMGNVFSAFWPSRNSYLVSSLNFWGSIVAPVLQDGT